MAVDSHRPTDATAHKGAENSRANVGHTEVTPANSSQNRDVAAGYRKDTANLHDVHIGTDAKNPADTNHGTVQKDASGHTIYSKQPDGKGGFTEARVNPDKSFVSREQQANGDFTQHTISADGKHATTLTHKQDGHGGFIEMTTNSDGTSTLRDQKANGDFKEVHYRGKDPLSERSRTTNGDGSYNETFRNKTERTTKSFDRTGHEVTPKAPGSEPNAGETVYKDARELKSPLGGKSFLKAAAGSARGALESAGNSGPAAELMHDAGELTREANQSGAVKALMSGLQRAEQLGKTMGRASGILDGIQIAGIGVQALEGDLKGAAYNAGRFAFTKTAAVLAGGAAAETGPVGSAIAGIAANREAGKLWDGVADGSINRHSVAEATKKAAEKLTQVGDSENLYS